MWYDIFFVLLLITSVVSTSLVYFSLRRINQYENFIISVQQLVEYSTEHMKKVDSTGHYESDDETGFFFDELKKLQSMLNDLFEPITEEENAKKKEK
jgi:hypothetical protein